MHVNILLKLFLSIFIITLFNIKQCYTVTDTILEHFNKGTKFHLVRDAEQMRLKMPANEQPKPRDFSADKCLVIENCTSTITQFKIQTKTAPSMETRTDIKFAYYTEAVVDYCNSGGWVLSGIFTGCLMAVWNNKVTGERNVGHVYAGMGTAGQLCKKEMKDVIKVGNFFKPCDDKRDVDIIKEVRAALDTNVDVFGLVSNDDEFYTIIAKKATIYIDQTKPIQEWEIVLNPILRKPRKFSSIEIKDKNGCGSCNIL